MFRRKQFRNQVKMYELSHQQWAFRAHIRLKFRAEIYKNEIYGCFQTFFIFQSLMIKIVNLNMEILVIHPENKEQLSALKALIKSWNINFEKYPYDPNFVAEINKREKNIKQGDFITIKDPGNVWESLL